MEELKKKWEEIAERTVQGPKDLRKGYEILATLLEDKPDKPHRPSVTELKKRLRAITKTLTDDLFKETRILKGDYDSYTELCKLEATSKKEAEEEYLTRHKITFQYEAYDCTGKPFSCWHKIIKKNNKYLLLHHVCYDV